MQKQQHPGQIGEHWLSKRRGSDNWCRTWYDANTRQTRRASLGTEDIREAQLALADWVTTNQTLRQEPLDALFLETVLVRYYENHASRLRSAESARHALRKWSDYFAGATVSELTVQRQEQFIHHLEEQGCSKGYIGRILGVGKAALNRARKCGEIGTVPYILTGSKGRECQRILSLEEAAALFNAVDAEHMLMYLLLAFNTLARPEAILELRRSQLDMDNRLIHLNPFGREQTKKRRPTVPITDTLIPWLQTGQADVLVAWRGKPLGSVKKGFRRLRERAGLSADVVPYTVRHTMATELRKRAVPAWEVAGFLGHKTEGVTERYAKFAPDYLSLAIQAIDRYFLELQPLVKRQLTNKDDLRVSCVLEPVEVGGQRIEKIGRGERIRTSGPCLPKAVLYQAELHPD